jgi:hypothetical protein
MTSVREIAVLKKRGENNIKLDFTTMYVMRTRAARYTHVCVQ